MKISKREFDWCNNCVGSDLNHTYTSLKVHLPHNMFTVFQICHFLLKKTKTVSPQFVFPYSKGGNNSNLISAF